MEKKEFEEILQKKGYIVNEDNGIPMVRILGTGKDFELKLKELEQIVRECEYGSSYGVRGVSSIEEPGGKEPALPKWKEKEEDVYDFNTDEDGQLSLL